MLTFRIAIMTSMIDLPEEELEPLKDVINRTTPLYETST